MLAWRDEYDLAGIVEVSRPPVELIQIAAEATHIVASDMRRAIASAERLAPHREIRVSPLFRETHLYVPRWPTRLPLTAWEMLVHGSWNYRILRRTDATPSDRVQATQAADYLSDVVADGSTALVVTHGVFRRLLAQHLVSLGWRSDGRTGGYDNWSYWRFGAR